VSAGGDARRTLTEGRRLIETPRSQAVAGGVELRHALSALDVVEAVAMAGWDGGVGGEVRVSLAGEGYFVAARGWRSHTQTSFVYFPADSLRDLGVRQLIRGLRIETGADVALGPVALHPVARVELTSLDETSETSEAFLFTSPQGESHTVELGADASWGRWEVDLEHRRRDVDMEARLLRSGASAGRLFYADADYRSWAVGAAMRAASGRWSLRAGRERTEGVLSTRVETWPFVSLWEQVTTQAYRLRGGLDGESLQLGLGRAPVAASGWSWGASVGRYVFRADRESWFVTGFGFGRSDQEETVEGVDPAIFVGGHAGRTFTLGPGTADARLEGGVPVHATEIPGAGTGGGPASDRGVAGYVAVSVAWRW
jgi:hypothetical protein